MFFQERIKTDLRSEGFWSGFGKSWGKTLITDPDFITRQRFIRRIAGCPFLADSVGKAGIEFDAEGSGCRRRRPIDPVTEIPLRAGLFLANDLPG